MNDTPTQTDASPKTYYVLGTNWYCYVQPNQLDSEFLIGDDLQVEICSKAADAYFGGVINETLTVIDKETEPMIGILFALTEKGKEEIESSYKYVPSYLVLGNCGKYASSEIAKKAHDDFMDSLRTSLEEMGKVVPKTKGKTKTKTSKKKKLP